MHDSRSYRSHAADCLSAAQETGMTSYRGLQLSMAVAWLSLAHHDGVLSDLLTGRDMAEPIKPEAQHPSQIVLQLE